MSDEIIEFDEVSSDTLRTTASYQAAFDHVRDVITRNDGIIKKDDFASGTIEAAYKYGINSLGLRITAQFRTLSEETIELHIKGGFVDALDTTGAGKKKAREITALVKGKSSSNQNPMPPRIGDSHVQNRGKRKSLAGILAILFGGIGGHKFYLGNWGVGIIFLVSIFIIPYVSAIIALIEGIRLLTMSEEDFDHKYNYERVGPFQFIW